jgi:hypothetical protein
VLVEEVQPMLSATYADEPLEKVAEDHPALTVSGPRFAALVRLTEEGAAKKPQDSEPKTAAPPPPVRRQPYGARPSTRPINRRRTNDAVP